MSKKKKIGRPRVGRERIIISVRPATAARLRREAKKSLLSMGNVVENLIERADAAERETAPAE